MRIVTYTMLERGDGGLSDPQWVRPQTDPHQLWHDPDDGTRVAIEPEREVLDASALLARAQSIHARYPLKNPDGSTMTAGELVAAVNAWLAAAASA